MGKIIVLRVFGDGESVVFIVIKKCIDIKSRGKVVKSFVV